MIVGLFKNVCVCVCLCVCVCGGGARHVKYVSCLCNQVEWMSEKIMRMFEDVRTNPFQFRYIICVLYFVW